MQNATQQCNPDEVLEKVKEMAEQFLSVYPQLALVFNGQAPAAEPATQEPYAVGEKEVSQLLQKFEMPTHIKGFRFTKTAIKLLLEDESLMSAVTKELYPTIAEEHKTTPSRVERAIRHAIQKVAETCNRFYANSFMYQPTNSEFLGWCIENLKFQK